MTPLMSRALMIRLASVVAGAIGFYLPLAAVPTFAAAHGAAAAAGLANGALLLATVAGEFATPRIVTRVGYRWTLAAGLALLGLPTPLLLLPGGTSTPAIVAVCVLRGAGFALSVVAGGALTAAILPAQRRGEGLALVGLVGGIPTLLALPLGPWIAAHCGYGLVFVLTAAAPTLAIASVPGLPGRDPAEGESLGLLAGLRNPRLARPAVIFASSASAAGVAVTYLPLAAAHSAGWVVPAALLAQPAASTGARWLAGRLGDRRGPARLIVPGVGLSVAGMAAMAITGSGVLVVAGAAVFGAGFGVLQNATLTLMYARVPASEYGTVSAIWNGAYDLGMAAGALAVAALVTLTGFAAAFAVVAASMLPALVLARREPATGARPARAAVEPVALVPSTTG